MVVSKEDELSDSELLEMFEDDLEKDDGFMSGYRERRLEEMKKELEKTRERKQEDLGQLSELKVEKDVIEATLKQKNTVVHFYHPDFRRCKLMDSHLAVLAKKHPKTRFIKVDVANVPFLVVKLEIKVLPCVIAFVDGITRDKIVGFETIGQGDSDNFTTAQLENRLADADVIAVARKEGAIQRPNY